MEAARVAAARAQQQAVQAAVTLLYGTITAVTATGVTVDFGDGSVVPNVPVLHPFVPRTGAVVRVASQGATLLVVGGVKANPTPVPVSVSATGPFSVSTLAYSSLSTPQRVAFVAPPSGRAVLYVKAQLTPTATARCIVSPRLLTSGLVEISTEIALLQAPAGGGTFSMGGHWYVSGLTAGTTYYGEVVAASGVAGTAVSIAYTRLMIVPEA